MSNLEIDDIKRIVIVTLDEMGLLVDKSLVNRVKFQDPNNINDFIDELVTQMTVPLT